ncbi:unnamed protein product, partial [Musa textilis]
CLSLFLGLAPDFFRRRRGASRILHAGWLPLQSLLSLLHLRFSYFLVCSGFLIVFLLIDSLGGGKIPRGSSWLDAFLLIASKEVVDEMIKFLANEPPCSCCSSSSTPKPPSPISSASKQKSQP